MLKYISLSSLVTLSAFTIAAPASACAPQFPPSFLDGDTSPYAAWPERKGAMCLLAAHFFPTEKPFSAPKHTPDPPDWQQSAEYKLFRRGYDAMRAESMRKVPEAWTQLLLLPSAERRYASARALYLLGNMHAKSAPDKAYEYYSRLRREVAAGEITDNRDLARQSWRSNYFYTADPVKKLRYMLPAFACGDGKTVGEAMRELNFLLTRHKKELLAGDDPAREMALFNNPRLLKTCHGKFLLADRMAFNAYQQCDFSLCRQLLEQVPRPTLLTLYLQARLARRERDYNLAARYLAQYMEMVKSSPAGSGIAFALYGEKVPEELEIAGLLGAVTVGQQHFTEALYVFMRSSHWPDAAAVAERFIKTDELVKFVTAHSDGKLPNYDKLRHLLARRLMREYRAAEAGKYFPAARQEAYQSYIAHVKRGNDMDVNAEERAAALFHTGRLLLSDGMELRGFELAPDFFICDGRYGEHPPYSLGTPSAMRRFHYRYLALEYFTRCAMASSDKELKKAALFICGTLTRDRDPEQCRLYFSLLSDLRPDADVAKLLQHGWFNRPPHNFTGLVKKCDPSDRAALNRLTAELAGTR